MRDVVAGYEKLMCLFERLHLFVERLNCYDGIPLTMGMTALLGKIMAQVLLVLALATKAMKEGRISEPVHRIYIFFAHDELEKFLKRLVGQMNVEDAYLRLDMLTKEETLMTAARNLQITHRVDHGATCFFFFIHFPTFSSGFMSSKQH
jgi:hypothetical protein